MKEIYVAASILSADFKRLEEEIKPLKSEGVDYLHFDVMDGHFVNNISFGSYVLSCIKDSTTLIKDVHLMITNPNKYIDDFIKAGAELITFHFEAVEKREIIPLINKIKENNVKVGLSIKPNTKVEEVLEFLPYLDLVLIMSVEPGFGGQKFIESSLSKIKELDDLRKENNYSYLIEIDGGINENTSKGCIENGVDILVSGSYIFKSENRKESISKLKEVKNV